MSRPAPTPEQQKILDAFCTGDDCVIIAAAGTGKTTTLEQVAAAAPGRRIAYVAYNKAIAKEAADRFPRNVECRTSHSFAYRAIGHRYSHRLKGPRIPGQRAAQILGIVQPLRLNAAVMLQPKQLARVAQEMVAKFCHSADPELHNGHLPHVNGFEDRSDRRALAEVVRPLAEKAWNDLKSLDGRLKFAHDHYLKLWQLSRPVLDYDTVLLDEAQDSNPAVADVVDRQKTHAQRVLVGDPHQAIYGWRGATDAMTGFDGTRLTLTQSFRFGPAIAAEANKWLQVLDSDLRVLGTDAVGSRLEPIPDPDTVLCRTNAGCVGRLLDAHDRGISAALVGGAEDIKKLAQAAITLKDGAGTDHPDLCMFTNWEQVRDYVENDHGGADLAAFIKLINNHGADRVLAATEQTYDETRARLVISTAHKAKGREWSAVQVADDFTEPKDNDGKPAEPSRPDAMLAYVTITRARKVLDRGGLAWVDRLIRTNDTTDQGDDR